MRKNTQRIFLYKKKCEHTASTLKLLICEVACIVNKRLAHTGVWMCDLVALVGYPILRGNGIKFCVKTKNLV